MRPRLSLRNAASSRFCLTRSYLLLFAAIISSATLLGGQSLLRAEPTISWLRRVLSFRTSLQPSYPCETAVGSRWRERLEVNEAAVRAVVAEHALLHAGGALRGGKSTTLPTLKVLLLAHLWNPRRADAVLQHWARPRCLELHVSDTRSTGMPAALVEVAAMYFEGSAAMADFDWERAGVAPSDVVHLSVNTTATIRTEQALPQAFARHPDASWLFKGDDDAFVHIGRLIRVLLAHDATALLLLGRAVDEWGPTFASGGAGYALSRQTLVHILPHLPTCNNATSGFRHTTQEDVMMTVCVQKHASFAALTDVPGINWHRPEYLLSRASFRDVDARATPISYHYIYPERIKAMTQPEVPPLLVQVWPFDVGALDTTLTPNALARFRENARSCETAAASVNLTYRLVNMRDTELAAAFYAGHLDARARELLYGLNVAYLDGGVVVSVWTACDVLTLRELLGGLVAAPPPQHQPEPYLDPLMSSTDFGATSGHAFSCVSGEGGACTLIATTQFNHNVFRLLAGLTRKIVHADASLFNNKFFGEFNIAGHWALFTGAQIRRNVSEDVRSPVLVAAVSEEMQIPSGSVS
jgi:hypothetical protein